MLESLFIENPDGGIINTITQVPQSEEPVVIIGLGGTGIDAITRLKRKLYEQIESDNKNAVRATGEEPRYEHIKFLGIDADKWVLNYSGLSIGETLNIQNYNYNVIFSKSNLSKIQNQKELQWMSIDYISKHLLPSVEGAGPYRQYGRWLTISSANMIKMKLSQVIAQACDGRDGNQLNVHIISGITGGTGGGSFVDICYITRKVIYDLGFSEAIVFGYFVLPDVIAPKLASLGRDIPNMRNGLAALLEIEHLMNLKDSNEWFEQDYGSFKICTQQKLVDACHLISATNMNGVPVPNGYEYALNVIGNHILTFLSPDVSGLTSMKSVYSVILANLQNINPICGYSQNYFVIGGASGEIPTTQMATYLATELFKKLTIRRTMPDNIQIEQEFADYLNLSDSRFKLLENQVTQGTGWTQITEQLVSQYFNQIKAHMNDDVLPAAMVNPTEASLRQRKALLVKKREDLCRNVLEYEYREAPHSLPRVALNRLIQIAEDPAKGPIYAYGMMNKTGVDIFGYLEGRLKYYASQKQNARAQESFFANHEPEAKSLLGNSNLFNKKRNIEQYVSTLNNVYYWQSMIDLFDEMEALIEELITAFREINNKYLKPLYKVTTELIETFDANSTYFQMGKGNQSQDGFTKQLVQFSNIQPELDSEIMKLDPTIETSGLMKILTTYPEIWMEGEELKLKAKISEYVLQKFHPILSGSLESFLRKDLNMQTANNSTFANAIQTAIIDPFVDTAVPLFWTNEPLVSDNTMTSHRSILMVPSAANCVCAAADRYMSANAQAYIKKSFVNDRLSVLKVIGGVPMHAYQGLVEYYDAYEKYKGLGLHLYEQDIDWRETLTFPYPYSYVPKYTKNADELLKLYADAEAKGIIYFQGLNAYVKQFEEIGAELLNIDGLKANGKMDMEMAYRRISTLERFLNSPVGAIPINSKGNKPGNAVVKDNFLRFYGIQQIVKQELERFDSLVETIESINGYINEEKVNQNIMRTFARAVFTDIFNDDGFNISYKYNCSESEREVILCNVSMPFGGLAKHYQAFKNMRELEEIILKDIDQHSNEKFSIMSRKEKKESLDKLLAMYNPYVLAMISQNYAETTEGREIDNFYSDFMKTLSFLIPPIGPLDFPLAF